MKKYLTSSIMAVLILFIINLALPINPAMAQDTDSGTAPPNYATNIAEEIRPDAASILIIKNSDPWGTSNVNKQALLDVGFNAADIATINSSSLPTTNLNQYKFVVYVSDQVQSYYDDLSNNINKISNYVNNGGCLVAHCCDQGWNGATWRNILPGGLGHQNFYSQSIHITAPGHCVVTGLNDNYFAGWNWSTHGSFTNLVAGTNVVMIEGNNNSRPTYVHYQYGQGQVWATMQTIEWGYGVQNKKEFLRNEFKCVSKTCGDCCKKVLKALELLESKNDAIEIKLDELGKETNSLKLMLRKLMAAVGMIEQKLDNPRPKPPKH